MLWPNIVKDSFGTLICLRQILLVHNEVKILDYQENNVITTAKTTIAIIYHNMHIGRFLILINYITT